MSQRIGLPSAGGMAAFLVAFVQLLVASVYVILVVASLLVMLGQSIHRDVQRRRAIRTAPSMSPGADAGGPGATYSAGPVLAPIAEAAPAASTVAARAAPVSRPARATLATPAPAPLPIAPPTFYSGTGDDVLDVVKPTGATTAIVTITGNESGDYFAVEGLNGARDLLVNTTQPYLGSVLMDADEENTTRLRVSATGPWSITLSDPGSAPSLVAGTTHGAGDAVLLHSGTTGSARITGNSESEYFGVEAHSKDGIELLVNTTDPYTGTVPLPRTPALVVVHGSGAWSFALS